MNGPIKWMANNHVAANILMLIFVVGGLMIGKNIRQEVFPETELEKISVSVSYPGSSPTEIEEGVIRPIERAVSGIDNVKRITASANEGSGTVTIELVEGTNVQKALDDVKSEVDRITTLPEDSEEPVVAQMVNRRDVMSLVLSGDVSELALFELAQRVQDDLLSKPNITQIELSAVRPPEIAIEISEENLRRYNLTLNEVATRIRQASLDMPGGSIKTTGGEILIRTQQKLYTGDEFARIAIINEPNGKQVKLGDIATVIDGFAEADYLALYDGKPAAKLDIFRVGEQSPKDIAETVKAYMDEIRPQLPSSVKFEIEDDRTELLNQRMDLLLRNGSFGFFLVLLVLTLFLEIRLAFFVAFGAAMSIVGALLIMPMLDVSINMISLFGFLIVLGMVVDDAIIVGENIYVHRKMGKSFIRAAVEGTAEVNTAVVFSVLTTVVAFAPLLYVSGSMANFMGVTPKIVITVLAISLIESLFILPSHLSGGLVSSRANIWIKIEKFRSKFDVFVTWFRDKTYVGTLAWVQRNRYTTVAIGVAVLLIAIGLVTGGFIKFVFFPRIDADRIRTDLTMAPGTSFDETYEVSQRILASGMRVMSEYDSKRTDGKTDLLHTFITVGGQSQGMGGGGVSFSAASNLARLTFEFEPSDVRRIDLNEFISKWRKELGDLPNIERLNFSSQLRGDGVDIDIQLAHDDYNMLLAAVDKLKYEMDSYAGVSEVNDSYSEGKRELKIKLRPEAASLGITETDLARQIRAAFYGAEALRYQRGRNELKVMVRYPREQRQTMASIENMLLRSPSGVEIPFAQAAYVEESQGYSSISRADRKRTVNVTAKVNNREANADEIVAELSGGLLQKLTYEYPGLTVDMEGASRERKESMASLSSGFLIALLMIYALLAVPFKSFTQPLVVMTAIPFGIVGAILGHIVFGHDLSLISMMGIVALAGVVVNNSLVMIDFINKARESGISVHDAVMSAGQRRFRPIIMTSLTTFFGLMPMILETSIQAKFLIPMAISLGCGVMFATGITLVLIPALYLILEDIHNLFKREETKAVEYDLVEREMREVV